MKLHFLGCIVSLHLFNHYDIKLYRENYFGATLNGDKQCSKGGGGTCQSFPGLNFYKCKCNLEITQIFANCNKIFDPRESHICQYGHCDYMNGTGNAYYNCDEDWEGEKCNIRSAIWLPWGHWSFNGVKGT